MTTRQFDPVFSAALRNELEALADAPETTEARPRPARPLLARPQVWVSLVTALVLAIATIGVLRLTHAVEPAEHPKSIDPMSQITDPTDDNYVAREVTVLAAARGTATGTTAFDVPASVTSVRVYLDCTPEGHYSTSLDGDGNSSGGCGNRITSFFDMPISAGSHTVTAKVAAHTKYSMLVIATPAPTVSAGALIDPLDQVRDLRDPDALTGSTVPIAHISENGVGGAREVHVTPGVRLRFYFACRPTSTTAEVTIAGHRVVGCMNSIAHWFDFTPTTSRIDADVVAPDSTAWAILLVRAPAGAKDSPASTTLAYPTVQGPVLARARGAGASASGTYRNPGTSLLLSVTCRGTGWLEMETTDGGTNTRGNACSTGTPSSVGFVGDKDGSLQKWSVIPHGDISWTFQLSSDD